MEPARRPSGGGSDPHPVNLDCLGSSSFGCENYR
jgi:hypothetical protein